MISQNQSSSLVNPVSVKAYMLRCLKKMLSTYGPSFSMTKSPIPIIIHISFPFLNNLKNPLNNSEQGECFLMSGVFGFALVVILGISSLPSVSSVLTWKEFAFIQSGLGWLAMILLCAHDMFYGYKYLDGPSCGMPSSFQVS